MHYIQKIENALKSRGLTAKKMLLDLGYSDNLISQWKKGSEPSAIKLHRICDYLDLSMDYVLEENITNNENDSKEVLSKELDKEYEDVDFIAMKGLHDYFSGISISDDSFKNLSFKTNIDENRLKSFYVDTK